MSQSLSQLIVHIIFSTKKRQPFLINLLERQQLYDYSSGVLKKYHCSALAIGGIEDHVHLLVHLSKNIALSTLIETLKTASSKWIKTTYSKTLYKNFYWQTGYAAFSVSYSQVS